ncbi:MAG TPA: hypothetical protein VEB22_03965, partial [Phycisphaerales bacterium]|nr:hypothetical protein [Phycisphaerales bacterium]
MADPTPNTAPATPAPTTAPAADTPSQGAAPAAPTPSPAVPAGFKLVKESEWEEAQRLATHGKGASRLYQSVKKLGLEKPEDFDAISQKLGGRKLADVLATPAAPAAGDGDDPAPVNVDEIAGKAAETALGRLRQESIREKAVAQHEAASTREDSLKKGLLDELGKDASAAEKDVIAELVDA